MKKKIMVTIILLICISFFSGITYSFFNSSSKMRSTNQGIANFIFEANKVDEIQLQLNELLPGDKKEYLFSVTNSNSSKISDVAIEYQIKIKTYHFIPTVIKLYTMEGEAATFLEECNETPTRDSNNMVVCNMPIETLERGSKISNDYKLEIEFPSEYNDVIYSNLVDFISIDIESWQKI